MFIKCLCNYSATFPFPALPLPPLTHNLSHFPAPVPLLMLCPLARIPCGHPLEVPKLLLLQKATSNPPVPGLKPSSLAPFSYSILGQPLYTTFCIQLRLTNAELPVLDTGTVLSIRTPP